ncbi:xylose isomerase-like protein [Ceraceosorus guamensis]|uniref:Xylose isomerase-like protein n=1 Tax=Ceraceosorus guamensis TaxID=1522189 RepID=A0A316VU22_9BASI|nr:xylose isomerase-like protein [Ceraceosorus guamensis]PWN41012.1 xylose isomerase-like protein [Ceraceosorus guamensis]
MFTHSAGAHAAGHSLTTKLRAIAASGLDAVEIFQDDLDAFAKSPEFQICNTRDALTPPDSPTSRRASDSSSQTSSSAPLTKAGLRGEAKGQSSTSEMAIFNAHGPCTPAELAQEVAAAAYIGDLCASLGLQVLNLQPLRDVEGWSSAEDQAAADARVRSRFPIMRALGTDLLLCCSNNQPSPRTTGDAHRIAQDLARMADEAKTFSETIGQDSRPLRIAYEGLSWGAHHDTWQGAWQCVELANRDNVGLVLDSFNTLGREFADPCCADGVSAHPTWRESLARIPTVPAEKIFLVQIGDARRVPAPLEPSPNAKEPRPSRMIWSRSHRLFPGEIAKGAFLPTIEFMHAVVVQAGYRGPWSVEVFNDSLSDEASNVPSHHANRAKVGLEWLFAQVLATCTQA